MRIYHITYLQKAYYNNEYLGEYEEEENFAAKNAKSAIIKFRRWYKQFEKNKVIKRDMASYKIGDYRRYKLVKIISVISLYDIIVEIAKGNRNIIHDNIIIR